MPQNRPVRRRLALALGLALACPALLACMWDYDTLRDERRGLPGIAEVLAGKWERHSRYFYERRVAAMNELLAREPGNLAAYDNLAVAHEKLGDPDAAIAVIERKDKLKPGEYTTHANLGTFHLHKGDFENGIRHIERALAINPEAHFGREEYQLKLAKYLRDLRASGAKPPLDDFLGVSFLQERDGKVEAGPDMFRGGPGMLERRGLKPNAFEGIVGMIRFGTGTSPDLYYALGNLLTLRGDKHLAFRAYGLAVEHGHPHRDGIKLLQEELKQYVEDHDDLRPEVIARERADAAAWVAAYQRYEDDLLRAGKDVEDEANYAAFYERHGTARRGEPFAASDLLPRDRATRAVVLVGGMLGGVVILVVAATLVLVRWRRRRRISLAAGRAGAVVALPAGQPGGVSAASVAASSATSR